MRFAITFPGQGSQSVGMMAELAGAFPIVKMTFDEASAVLGYDLWNLVQSGPEEMLNRTECTQPAMLAAGVASWRVWCKNGGSEPEAAVGHSLGEYTALVCAEALRYADAVRLVAARGRFMQEAVPVGQGAIAAILGLEDESVRAVCERAAEYEVVQPVNFNAPGQIVIAGHAAAVDRALELARTFGARRSVRIAMSVPSHCSLMQPAADRLAAMLAEVDFATPRIQVIHNADVSAHPNAAELRQALSRQVHSPVRWVETIQRLAADGIETLVELGPGRVLTGLNKRINRDLRAIAVHDQASLREALSVVQT